MVDLHRALESKNTGEVVGNSWIRVTSHDVPRNPEVAKNLQELHFSIIDLPCSVADKPASFEAILLQLKKPASADTKWPLIVFPHGGPQ